MKEEILGNLRLSGIFHCACLVAYHLNVVFLHHEVILLVKSI